MHPFGKKFREAYFNIDKDVTPVNHGSYGLVPIPVQEAFLDHMKRDMAYPDRYIRQEQRQDIDVCHRQSGPIGRLQSQECCLCS